jgi:hypothetical protein
VRRLILFAALLVVAVVALPAAGTSWDSCTATTAVTASAVVAETAPSCSVREVCPFTAVECHYAFALDVNGTGLVSGTLSVRPSEGFGSVTILFVSPTGVTAADSVSCSGAFRCHYPPPNGIARIIAAGDTPFEVTCTGGGLAAVETVSCGVLNPL